MKIDNELSADQLNKIFYPAYVWDEKLLKNYINGRTQESSVPKNPKTIPGTIWAITTFFNPAKYANKYENYKIFRENSKRQGLNLLTVELNFDEDSPYEMQEEDADILIQMRGGEENILWQKEALLNIALKRLPSDCDKIIWIDCDIVFHNDNWVSETSELLEQYCVVQPFSTSIRLPQHCSSSNELTSMTYGTHDCQFIHSVARGLAYLGKDALLDYDYMTTGHVGFAWSIRREIMDEFGFFMPMINGANDSVITWSFYGYTWTIKVPWLPHKLVAEMQKYQDKIYQKVRGSVYFTNGVIDHLWHGSVKHRGFGHRERVLYSSDFDPETDITLAENGLLEWSTDKTRFKKSIKNYFWNRREEG